MKIRYLFRPLFTCVFFLSIQSCIKDQLKETTGVEEEAGENTTPLTDLTELQIPEGFEFTTSKTVTITINDNAANATYTVYAYSDIQYNIEEIDIVNDSGEPSREVIFDTDELNQVLFTGRPVNGTLQYTLKTPSYYSQIYVRRKEGGSFTSEIVNIQNGAANYNFSDNSGKIRKAEISSFKNKIDRNRTSVKNIEIDTLYAVNGSGQLFSVNPLDGGLKELAAMPMGSYTAAIDHANMYLYSIGKNNGNPLMRYDMVNDSWTTIANVGMGGPRLDYREEDGLLYFSTGAKLYSIDPNNASVIASWDITNLDVTGGGDLAFAPDGTLFLSSFGGLYRLDFEENNSYRATRISADNLPFNPTSMTFDSNNELWLASNGSDSNLIIMDTVTGGWEYVYGPNSTSGVSFGRTINDLTTYTIADEDAIDPDTDGDGITDSNDTFPNDADKAFEQFTPSKYGWGTVAFEDLWPFLGDYDFNDTAINYRFVAVLNAENRAVQLDIYYEVTSDGAGLTNGFGIALENIAPERVTTVTGSRITQNYITLNTNGLEANQSNAVVILFDSHEGLLNVPGLVSLRFDTPITTAELGQAPFNPFLIVGEDRTREIHLPAQPRTDLGENMSDAEGVNYDIDGDFKTDSGLPWAINIIHNFRVPKERVPVNEAYNFFVDWATSGGEAYPDWYKDNPGYRNSSQLKN